MEYFDSYILVILKMLRYYNEANTVRTKQISIILGPTFVLSFQEMRGGVLNLLRDSIQTGKGRIRRIKSDYLAYSLLESIVDHYFILLEQCGERIESVRRGVGTEHTNTDPPGNPQIDKNGPTPDRLRALKDL